MGFSHLTVVILQKKGFVALGHADAGVCGTQPGCVLSGTQTLSGGLNAHQFGGIIAKITEESHGVGATADTCVYTIRQPIFGVQHLFAGVGRVLAPGGAVCIYGPFRYGGQYTSTSNAVFDQSLRRRDTASGIRDCEAVQGLAAAQGLELVADDRMPANNQLIVFARKPGGKD